MSDSTFHLGLDIDGIFADFNGHPDTHGFAQLLCQVTKRDLFPRPWSPTTWHWWGALGYKPSEGSETWEHLKASGAFWRYLPPYDGTQAFFRTLNSFHEIALRITFLTTRPGLGAHYQTRAWLVAQGLYAPQVIITADAKAKGILANALGLDAYVDDYPPNVQAVREMSPKTDCRLYRAPWNRDVVDPTALEDMAALEAWVVGRLQERATTSASAPSP